MTRTSLRTGQRVAHRRISRIKTYEEGRICVYTSPDGVKCTTILSVSNKPMKIAGKDVDLCYTHRPRKLPRTRGVATNSPNHVPMLTSKAASIVKDAVS